MTQEKLLELQTVLLAYLTDAAAFNRGVAGQAGWESLRGLDPGRLQLLALLAHGKRLDKIRGILPRTFRYLERDLQELSLRFASDYPPVTASNIVNARQFYAFLCRTWRASPPDPPFLPDLAYCELALMSVGRRDPPRDPPLLAGPGAPFGPLQLRRRPEMRWHRCRYNVRPLLEGLDGGSDRIEARPVCVIVCRPLNALRAQVFQVDEDLLGLLESLRGWAYLPAEGQAGPLIRQLEHLGIVEVRQCESA